jgi:hypothetical protein
MMLSPSTVGGETWETRPSLGLQPNKHYLELSNDPRKVCDDIKAKLSWMESNIWQARQMALDMRGVALGETHSFLASLVRALILVGDMRKL